MSITQNINGEGILEYLESKINYFSSSIIEIIIL